MTGTIPYCEPISLPSGQTTHVDVLNYANGENHPCFYHFHDVCEVVLFKHVSGQFSCFDQHYQLSDSSLVFIPSMAVHNFNLSLDRKSWQIIQFSPILFNILGLVSQQSTLQKPLVLELPEQSYYRYHLLLDWLAEFNQRDNALKQDILSTLIRQLAHEIGDTPPAGKSLPCSKLQPLLDKIRKHQQIDLSMAQAAEVCKLSPSYFSRLFKKVFQQSYSQYMLRYRLHLASRMLTTSDQSISTICYELNFTHPSYFISVFKQYFGVTPKKYRSASTR